MTSRLRITRDLVVSATALVLSISAQASRTFVATSGNDSNAAVNCSPSANCRTFAAALSVTNPGGEVVVLSSGGYGPATIAQPVVITAIGIDASISVTTSGANGLTINTPGNVTLIGLNLHGEASGGNGIKVQQVGILRLYNMLIENFTVTGVDLEVSGKLAVYNSEINDNAGSGLLVTNPSASAYVLGTSFDHNSNGVNVVAGQATVVDSSALYNGNLAFTAGGTLMLFNDRAMFNGTALSTELGGALYFADCVIMNNINSYQVGVGSAMSGTSPGTTLIGPGQTASGTLSTALTLQ